jgi:hypothetical protein
MASYEEVREGIQEAEAILVISKAGYDKSPSIPAELAERCRQILADDLAFHVYQNKFQGGYLLTRTNHYGWQEHSQRLFTVAGEVTAKLGK